MTDAPPVAGEYEQLPERLLAAVPGFADSPEAAAAGARRDRSAAVAAALGRYLLRLQRASIRRQASLEDEQALERAYPLLEELASSDDPDVRRALAEGILDPLHSDDVVVAVLETVLGPRTIALYRRWAV